MPGAQACREPRPSGRSKTTSARHVVCADEEQFRLQYHDPNLARAMRPLRLSRGFIEARCQPRRDRSIQRWERGEIRNHHPAVALCRCFDKSVWPIFTTGCGRVYTTDAAGQCQGA